MKKEYYTFQTICRDCAKNGQILEPYLADEDLMLFDTMLEAWEAAGKAAEEEVEELNSDCDEEVSFGISEGLYEYQKMGSVVVECYVGNETEWVTKRVIRKVVKQLSPGMYELKARDRKARAYMNLFTHENIEAAAVELQAHSPELKVWYEKREPDEYFVSEYSPVNRLEMFGPHEIIDYENGTRKVFFDNEAEE